MQESFKYLIALIDFAMICFLLRLAQKMIIKIAHMEKTHIQKLSEGCFIDFMLVRDTMYNYSKKAEERFFRNSTMAYFFI